MSVHSERGANNLAKIIALKMEKGFKDKIAMLVSGNISERLLERFEEILSSARTTIKETVKKPCRGRPCVCPMHKGKIPFSECKVTNARKAIRSMFDIKPFSEMVYR